MQNCKINLTEGTKGRSNQGPNGFDVLLLLFKGNHFFLFLENEEELNLDIVLHRLCFFPVHCRKHCLDDTFFQKFLFLFCDGD